MFLQRQLRLPKSMPPLRGMSLAGHTQWDLNNCRLNVNSSFRVSGGHGKRDLIEIFTTFQLIFDCSNNASHSVALFSVSLGLCGKESFCCPRQYHCERRETIASVCAAIFTVQLCPSGGGGEEDTRRRRRRRTARGTIILVYWILRSVGRWLRWLR